jgi:hypothetical protein
VHAVTGAGARQGVLEAYGLDALENDPELTAIARSPRGCAGRWRRSSTSSTQSGNGSSGARD